MTASSMRRNPLRFLAEVVGLDQVVLGSDYSFPPADLHPLASLEAAGLSAADIAAVAEGNPRRLFKRLKNEARASADCPAPGRAPRGPSSMDCGLLTGCPA